MMNEWPIILCFVPIEAVHLYLPMKIKLTAKGQSGTRTAASKLKDQSVARGANFRRRHIVIPSLYASWAPILEEFLEYFHNLMLKDSSEKEGIGISLWKSPSLSIDGHGNVPS
ncbi:PREDICTED: uncharacterized protein LOC108493986 isoform X5 [Lepidothrix coronata]|uniref:Uncharacterized protein LOC108493986 isoform X5 n=1 Tax=Lepidothrix coronata TaxID=321398 RepID=A0A6J0GP36_9PASS|nr:PREDICTED: uncharacterized protein LOC108493986 isoform X5 [Lepidothrix coronata]XP_017663521.1 PREDICTED: uncharacterized protein LOC108493986 isoform X5 [Lepidothrix coronata]XP_017663522.1 PREDICTED: uncharacterized protein LOC108493986 isoform X5 [Lepidothrix coronata]